LPCPSALSANPATRSTAVFIDGDLGPAPLAEVSRLVGPRPQWRLHAHAAGANLNAAAGANLNADAGAALAILSNASSAAQKRNAERDHDLHEMGSLVYQPLVCRPTLRHALRIS
jgi:hypothetical protein